MINIALFGYSGHAFVVAETIELMDMPIIGYYDKKEAPYNPFKLNYLGSELVQNNLKILFDFGNHFFVSIGDNQVRKKVSQSLNFAGFRGVNVIHPTSIISRFSSIESEVFIAAGVKVNALASVSRGAILNTGCIIEHECKIGSYAHIAPGAVLAGNVKVGDGSFVGANAVIKQGIIIGENVIVGAGAVVLKDIPDNIIVAGNPAKLLK